MRKKYNNPLLRVDHGFYKELKIISHLNGHTITRTTNELMPIVREIRIKNEEKLFKKYEPNLKKIVYCFGLFAMLSYFYFAIYSFGWLI